MKKFFLLSLCSYTLAMPLCAEESSEFTEKEKKKDTYRVQEPADKIYLDTLSFKLGLSQTSPDIRETNGSIAGIAAPEEQGTTYSLSAVFNNEYMPFLKPYIEYARINYDDRNFSIYSLGLRHDRFINDAQSWEWFISGGLGRGYSHWTNSPAPAAASGVAGDESVTATFQTGLDWYFTPSWAIDMTLRYDLYDMDTTVVQNSQVTTISDGESLSALVGIVYRFGQRSRQDQRDNDGDGVPNYLDRCSNTLENVPVNGRGCPQESFMFNLSFEFAQFKVENMVDKPSFKVVEFLQSNPEYSVHINGYADNTGGTVVNKKLSYRRAKAAADKLIENGIASERLSYEGKGQKYQWTDNDSKASREQNRRIEAIFYKAGSRSSLIERREEKPVTVVTPAKTETQE
ncbi:MAG: OmpA family protein [Pseudomonadales bacterium]|nr:OmpA family protein [Pseudomonadales bacterium]